MGIRVDDQRIGVAGHPLVVPAQVENEDVEDFVVVIAAVVDVDAHPAEGLALTLDGVDDVVLSRCERRAVLQAVPPGEGIGVVGPRPEKGPWAQPGVFCGGTE